MTYFQCHHAGRAFLFVEVGAHLLVTRFTQPTRRVERVRNA